MARMMDAIGRQGAFGVPRCTRRVAARAAGRHTYRLFVVSALAVGLTSGFTLGATLVLGYVTQAWTRAWLAHAQVHGHTQVWGWTLLFIAGVLLHVLPRLKTIPATPGATVGAIYTLLMAGLLTRAVGQPLADQPLFAVLFLTSGPLELAGVSLLVATVVRLTRRALQPRDLFDGYLSAALRWLWIGTALEAWVAVGAARAGALVVGGNWHEAALIAMLWGFATLTIGAFSVRIVTAFLRLPPPRLGVARLALRLLEAGVGVSVLSLLAEAALLGPLPVVLRALGALVLALGVLALTHSVSLCPLGQLRTPIAAGTAWFAVPVRTSYLWLVVAATLAVAQALGPLAGGSVGYFALSGARHALTLGFITMIIFGMAARFLPAFSGHPWWGRRLLWLAFGALNVAIVLRTALQPALGYGAGGLLAAAALLAWLAFVLFALAALGTIGGWGQRATAADARSAP